MSFGRFFSTFRRTATVSWSSSRTQQPSYSTAAEAESRPTGWGRGFFLLASGFGVGLVGSRLVDTDAKEKEHSLLSPPSSSSSSSSSVGSSLVASESRASKQQQPTAASKSVLDIIGDTPLLELQHLNPNPLAKVYVKLEFVNPSGSIKDRIAKHIIETFEHQGVLKPGGVIIENSSGNTAAGVAMLAAFKGYKAILVVPNKCSKEKVAALRAFGARVIVAPPGCGPTHPHHYENIAKHLAASIPGSVRLDQYNNQLNVEAHYLTTGPEIWQQTHGNVDYFVCGASTGGTISGVGRYLKDVSDGHVRVYVADPQGSMLLPRVKTGVPDKSPGSTQIEGIGKDYEVACTHFDVIDDGLLVSDEDAFRTARRMAQEEGIMCGISSGANVWAALELAKQATEPTTIVTVLPDGGNKYFSKIFASEFLLEHRLIDAEEAQEMDQTDTVETMDELIKQFSS